MLRKAWRDYCCKDCGYFSSNKECRRCTFGFIPSYWEERLEDYSGAGFFGNVNPNERACPKFEPAIEPEEIRLEEENSVKVYIVMCGFGRDNRFNVVKVLSKEEDAKKLCEQFNEDDGESHEEYYFYEEYELNID